MLIEQTNDAPANDAAANLRLPAELLQRVDRLAEKSSARRSDIMREALRRMFADLEAAENARRQAGELLSPEVREVLEDLPGGDARGTLMRCVLNEHRRQYPRRASVRFPALGVHSEHDIRPDALISEVLVTPSIDALVCGVCLGDIGDEVAEWLESHEVRTGPRDVVGQARFGLDRGGLYADGQRVGRVAFSTAPTTRYGRNLLFSFTGAAFRADGAALLPQQCIAWMVELVRHALEELGRDFDCLRFVTVNRVDYVVQVDLRDGVTAADLRALTLPDGYLWGDTNASHTGVTHYASQSVAAMSSRGKQPTVRCYDKTTDEHCPEGQARIEIEIPRVRHVSGDQRSFGFAGAAQIAAEVFAALLPDDAPTAVLPPPSDEVLDDAEAYQAHLQTPGVHVIDARGVRLAEEINRKPYAGHNAATNRRLARQALTLMRRGIASYITALTISGSGLLDLAPRLDVPDEIGCRLYSDGALVPWVPPHALSAQAEWDICDAPPPSHRDYMWWDMGDPCGDLSPHSRGVYCGAPGLTRCQAPASGVPLELVRAGLLADPRGSLRELVHEPMFTLEELDEMALNVAHIRQLTYPRAGRPSLTAADERNTWLDRMFARIDHEPLRTGARVVATLEGVEVWDRTGTRLTHRQRVDWLSPAGVLEAFKKPGGQVG